MNDIVWLTMRRLRTPLIVLILTYFTSVFIVASVPGMDADGNVVYMGYLDAAYFIAILATTIGLGEVPYAFTGLQRLVVFTLIFPNVIAWLYSVGAILGLVLDNQFKAQLSRNRFARRVRWNGDPFYVVCGCGNTGSMLALGLMNRGLLPVVLEKNENRVHSLMLQEAFSHVPMLACDTTDRRNLELAGIHQPNCRGVIATTHDDHANLTIAITSKLLNPQLPVFARSENQRVSDNMASFGTDFVVDPYAIFAERLYLALTSPIKYLVQDWLIAVPGTKLRKILEPPTGRWIVCGAGRFGERMIKELEDGGQAFTVVDVRPERVKMYANAVLGRGTEASTLEDADIQDAVGIIAGTGDDIDNLSIVMTALQLNTELFVVARQERQQNDVLFDASRADLVAKRSLIVARRILAVATTPLLKTFLEHLVHESDAFAQSVAERLNAVLNDRSPSVWLADLSGPMSRGVVTACREGIELRLEHLTHNTRSGEDEGLPCVCLILERGAQRFFMPSQDEALMEGDRLLFAGRSSARREMDRALVDPVLLMDYATPNTIPRTAIGRWFAKRAG